MFVTYIIIINLQEQVLCQTWDSLIVYCYLIRVTYEGFTYQKKKVLKVSSLILFVPPYIFCFGTCTQKDKKLITVHLYLVLYIDCFHNIIIGSPIVVNCLIILLGGPLCNHQTNNCETLPLWFVMICYGMLIEVQKDIIPNISLLTSFYFVWISQKCFLLEGAPRIDENWGDNYN